MVDKHSEEKKRSQQDPSQVFFSKFEIEGDRGENKTLVPPFESPFQSRFETKEKPQNENRPASEQLRINGEKSVFDFHTQPHRGYEAAKRVTDLFLSVSASIILFPLFLTVALAIKLTSRGPVFFRQDRVGKDGEVFKIFKFRTMRSMDNGAVIKQAERGDPRITRVGAFLRASSIDELPQIFNVLLGDMSLVGPRPHAVAHDQAFEKTNPDYVKRRSALPGLTGLAQVNGYRGETDTQEKLNGRVRYDAQYVANRSLWLDIKIIMKTFLIVFRRVNAY